MPARRFSATLQRSRIALRGPAARLPSLIQPIVCVCARARVRARARARVCVCVCVCVSACV